MVASKWVLEGAVDGVWGLLFVLYVEKLDKDESIWGSYSKLIKFDY